MGSEVIIAGAGLAGLTAGITLARRGRAVTILEGRNRIGGDHSYADSSYIDPQDIRGRFGLEIEEALEPWTVTRIHAYGLCREIPHPAGVSAYTIERGRGERSLENVLYRQALKEGVKVELGQRLDGAAFKALPPGSILATGLDAASFKALDIPCRPFMGHMATGKGAPGRPGVIVYFDEFCREFGYYFQARSAAGALVFNVTEPLSTRQKETFKERLAREDGISFDGWHDRLGTYAAWPLGGWDNRRLFWKDKILAGTLAGAVSPVLVFGVHGALVSGHAAALAVLDRRAGEAAFRAAIPASYYFPQLLFRKMRETLPHAVLAPLIRSVVAAYHPSRFPYLMKFVMEPPGFRSKSKSASGGRGK